MSGSRTKNTILNMFSLFNMQLITAISGLILPSIMIKSYGSEANGLVASITQFLSYITLLEGGAGGVVRAAFYKPLAQNDMEKVSGIVKASDRFYSQLALWFVIYVAGICFVYPLISNTDFGGLYIVTMILVLSISKICEYLIGYTYQTLIIADQKNRVVNKIGSITLILNIIITVILIKLGASIHFVKLVSCLVFVLRPVTYMLYVKKNYALPKDAKADNEAISQKKNGLVHQIAYFLHMNTDVFLITIFMTATDVSVYAIYYAVVSGIETIASCFMNASTASIGNMLAKEDEEHISDFFDKFEFIQMGMIGILFTITAILIIPFMQVYSKGFTDANYICPLFAYILIIAEATYCIRRIYAMVSTCANQFKRTQAGAVAESVINLVMSLILINFFGLPGVALGTFFAMLARAVFEIGFMSKNVIRRPIYKSVKCLITNIFVSFVSVGVCTFVCRFSADSWYAWIMQAVIVGSVTVSVAFLTYLCFYRDIMFNVLNRIKNYCKGR